MSTVLVINGSTINRVTTQTTILHCRPYAKDGYPELTFARAIRTLTSGPDPWDGQAVTLTEGGTLIFAGDTGTHLTHYDPRLGWVPRVDVPGPGEAGRAHPGHRQRHAHRHVPVQPAPGRPGRSSRAARAARWGRSCAAVLEMSQNKTALVGRGVGNYSSSGTGAARNRGSPGGGGLSARSPSPLAAPGIRQPPPCSSRAAAAPAPRRRPP